MVYEPCFTSHGLRIMVYEPWFTSHGLRIMVYESWFTSHGLRTMVYESWFTKQKSTFLSDTRLCTLLGAAGPGRLAKRLKSRELVPSQARFRGLLTFDSFDSLLSDLSGRYPH